MDSTVVGAGVRRRLADVSAVIERQSAFVFSPEGDSETIRSVRRPAARDFVLRTLGAAADTLNYQLLTELHTADARFVELCERFRLAETAAWERVNDLVQAGLVARDSDYDRIGLTATGIELVLFVEAAAATAEADQESGP